MAAQINSGIPEHNGIFVSGVFCRIAMMALLSDFTHLVPEAFATYQLQREPDDSGDKVIFPPATFPYATDAIEVTIRASAVLANAHEEFARAELQRPHILRVPPRVEIP